MKENLNETESGKEGSGLSNISLSSVRRGALDVHEDNSQQTVEHLDNSEGELSSHVSSEQNSTSK